MSNQTASPAMPIIDVEEADFSIGFSRNGQVETRTYDFSLVSQILVHSLGTLFDKTGKVLQETRADGTVITREEIGFDVFRVCLEKKTQIPEHLPTLAMFINNIKNAFQLSPATSAETCIKLFEIWGMEVARREALKKNTGPSRA